MSKYHLNEKGEPGKCSAVKGNCPFGDSDRHYESSEEARVAYEINQFANTMPEGMKLDDDGRKTLRLPGSNDPVNTGLPPQPMTGKAYEEKLDELREVGRKIFEAQIGGRTYKLDVHNERGTGDGTDAVHMLEVDAPYDAKSRRAFIEFAEKAGLTYDMRRTRASLFKPRKPYVTPTFEENLEKGHQNIARMKLAKGTINVEDLYKEAKKKQDKVDSMPLGLNDVARRRLLQDRDDALGTYRAANIALGDGLGVAQEIKDRARVNYESDKALELAHSDHAKKTALADQLGTDAEHIELAIMRTQYKYRDIRRGSGKYPSELKDDKDFVHDTSWRLQLSEDQVKGVLDYVQGFVTSK